MTKRKRWILMLPFMMLGLLVLYIAGNFLCLDFMVDWWWYKSLNLESYFILQTLYPYIVFSGATGLFFMIFFANFFVASRYLGTVTIFQAGSDKSGRNPYQKLIAMIQSGSLKFYTPLALVLTIPITIPFFNQWEEVLLWLYAPKAKLVDPLFHNDISYYFFSLPVYEVIQSRLILVFLLLLLATLGLYLAESYLLSKDGTKRPLPTGSRIHLASLTVLVFMIQVWGLALQRYELLYVNTHEPLYFGPGYVETHFNLPMIWAVIFFYICTGALLAIYFMKRNRKIIIVMMISTICLCLSYGLKGSHWIPHKIEEWIVKSNEVKFEKRNIAHNIEATLDAFDLHKIETKEYPIKATSNILDDPQVKDSLRNIPVWDRSLLHNVYTQLQTIRNFYEFSPVDVDRYTVADLHQQVYLAARELKVDKLPHSAGKKWVNRRLIYTHGYGAVMTPASQKGDQVLTWFVKNMPLESDFGFRIMQPKIYYGLGSFEDDDFVIAPTEQSEIDHSNQNAAIHYDGHGGIPINGTIPYFSYFLRKAMLSAYFKDKQIFLTTNTNENSRILFRRNIKKSIQRIAPFLKFDRDPYLVVTYNKLFWVHDAYTISDRYPYASYNDKDNKDKFNYIRNSVKITVDAYNGDIACYLTDLHDPIARAYARMYPGLLLAKDKMPVGVQKHLRYPKEIFEIQMSIYAKYHQTVPEQYFNLKDTWEFAHSGGDGMLSYYLTLTLPGREEHEFLLVSPMCPIGRDNLRSLVVAGCENDNYGKIVVYSFPKGIQIYGPAQINALFDQDTYVAQELTLWDQAGSEVIRGRTILLPLANRVLYIQPVYLRSAPEKGPKIQIPELKRIIISEGTVVVMDATLEGAIQQLEKKLQKRSQSET